ncbi:DUF1833 family protein [Burkholderiaceae bacterium UC74_6]
MVTPAGRAQVRRVDDPAGMVLLMKLEHPAIETIYVVNDTRDWTVGGITYVGLPFRITLPQSIAGQAPRSKIEVDNVGGQFGPELEALPPNGALQATCRLVSRLTPDVTEFEFTAPLSGVSCTPTVLTAVIGNDDAMRAPVVLIRFTPENSPGIFAG